MLVLTRKKGQRVVIGGGDIVLEVLDDKFGNIKLGFSASSKIAIDREEIHERRALRSKEQVNVI